MKKLLLILALTFTTLFAGDVRLDKYPQAQEWEKTANLDADSAYNLGLIYQTKIKDFNKVISLYEQSYKLKKSNDVANNLGAAYEYIKNYQKAIKWYEIASEHEHSKSMINLALLYKKQYKDYDKAIEWFKKAYLLGNMGGANGLGFLYDVNLKNTKEGIEWFKKAAKGGHSEAINNLGRTYHGLKDDVKASAYILAMINYGYTKKEVFNFLKNDWKIDDETLKKAYQVQLKLDIPKHYTGGID